MPSRPPGESPASGPELLPVGLAFFASGVAGLAYQVVWQRILALHSGVGIYSVAIIVAAFMAGLGLGAHLGGAWSLRLRPRRALALFGALELGIGLFGALSCWLYHDVLYARFAILYRELWRAAILHFLGLALPTTLMGMTLPLLTRAAVRSVAGAQRSIGFLYAINMAGAALGAWLTPWVLIRFLGMRGAALTAAGCNALAAALALLLAARVPAEAAQRPHAAAPEPAAAPAAPRQPLALWAALYALSGFCALSLELVWFRFLDTAVKSTAFTFGTLLAFYLAGTALGCFAGIPLAARLARPLRAFLLCQCAMLAYAAAALVALCRLPRELPLLDWYARYWQGAVGFTLGGENDPQALLRLYVLLPLLVFGPPTFLMGLSFPALQRAVQDDVRSSGRKVGLLQAANIAGCVTGSLLVGLVMLAWIGSSGTLRLLLACGVAFAIVGLVTRAGRAVFGALALLLAGLALAVPGQDLLWRTLHGGRDDTALVEEDATGVAAIVETNPRVWRVFVNGKSHSWVPFGGIHTQLGAVPALVHPAPVDVAIIGLGSGDTAWAAACRSETRSLNVFEIVGPQQRLLQRLAEREELPALERLLSDPRLSLRVADGRHAVAHGVRAYDLIEADALWPNAAYSGNLYSTEFFAECARRLKPGGVMCTWSPTPRVYASFTRVFPHVLRNKGRSVLIGSLQPLQQDPDAWLARLRSPEVAAYLGEQAPLVERMLATLNLPARMQRFRASDLNRDLHPRDEFMLP